MLYDRETVRVMKRVLKKDSVCIDIGCHKGELLQEILKYADKGPHFAFEPIPSMFIELNKKFATSPVTFYQDAVSFEEGRAVFNYVKNAPAYSGLSKRKYAVENPDIEEVDVKQSTLDNLFPDLKRLDLIKVDVEGGELNVFKGAKKLIGRTRPYILFEFGLGSAEYYKATPQELFSVFNELNYNLFLITKWLKRGKPLSEKQFCQSFYKNTDYYFLAVPKMTNESD